jgi:hypothetical protein
MNKGGRHFRSTWGVAATAVLAALCGCGTGLRATQAAGTEKQPESAMGKLYCNVGALPVEERARHSATTKKLIAMRDAVVETPGGYEFHFTPANVSVAELAEWVVAESKCCPFFNFHIDLEKEGKLVCLGLTGPEGVQAFIRAEFAVKDESR